MTDETPILPGLQVASRMTTDDWFAKQMEVMELFSPTHPIKETDMFNGRTEQLQKIMSAIMQAGQHAILYGDRGVGKTSLVNTVTGKLLANSRFIRVLSIQCYDGDDFVSIWERIFRDFIWLDGSHAFDDIDSTVTPDDLLRLLSKFGGNMRPLFIFDEFDRITDSQTKLKMAETIKLFSDKSGDATILLVGVGRTIKDLIAGHESITRAIRQIDMPRMSAEEATEVIKSRISKAGMTIDEEIVWSMVWLGHGMPGFVHLLGMHGALAALKARKMDIGDTEFVSSLHACLDEVAESTRQAYADATRSARPNNLLQQSLLACAVADTDEFGYFTAASVRYPLSKILKKEREIPDFSRHITAFCDENHGPILHREGRHKNYRYRFIDPMMQSYIITRGVADGLLTTQWAT